ncbi:MAG: endospore germination permease [Clostridium sp.]|jgi:spore germination protein (amino acid permease)|uniref:endospore germination permease n=1 Tax=Clostridium sp. TaxID=1506 RepID=UPI0025B92714|nr:endospore germination permease [Clostridium sp.]MCH3965933.1 endospore germination permease [Clostridium sp.]MCI1715978.1 endospore germination permease [Clostridium sp.]MCI1800350.1 endospore germination permease [Clostridium sp.]MCI1814155.1 endospore germination permease [Clostridium sp.]MCI1871054.1 endospore germination permease [Clostridium sp.]
MDKLNFKHIFFLICAVSIASQKTYPEIFINLSGRDSWVADIAACVIMILYFDYIVNIWVKNKCKSIIDVFDGAFGKLLGRCLLAIFVLGMFLSLVESASVESSVMHTNMFIESPVWYIALFVVLPGLYIVKNGKQSVMIVIIISMVISVFNGINLSILTQQYKDYRRLFPIFQNGLNINFFTSIVKTVGMYSSISIVIPLLSQLKTDKKLRKYAFLSNLFIAQMVIVSTIGLLATFNSERASTLVYGKLIQTQLVTYFGFIASGEFYVIFQTIASWFAKYIASFFSIMVILKELRPGYKLPSLKIQIVLTLIVYIISYFSARKLLVLFKLLNIYIYICIVLFFILPIAAFTIFNFKNKVRN